MRRVSQQEWENEHMHNQMTEGEALAVAQEAYDAARVGGNHEHDALTFAVRALTAHTAASGGEVQKRAPVQGYHGQTIPWWVHGLAWEAYAKQYGTRQSAERLAQRGGFGTCEMDRFLPGWREMAEGRTTPAAVPADALERLVEKWRADKVDDAHSTSQWDQGYAYGRSECADELAALIPKGADHG